MGRLRPAIFDRGGRALYARADALAYIAQRRVVSTADAQARGISVAPKNKKRGAPGGGRELKS
jgi:hypothetical protein